MGVIMLILGLFLGILIACVGFLALVIGTLKFARELDSDDPYLFVEFDNPRVMDLTKKHYVVLKVDHKVISQE